MNAENMQKLLGHFIRVDKNSDQSMVAPFVKCGIGKVNQRSINVSYYISLIHDMI